MIIDLSNELDVKAYLDTMVDFVDELTHIVYIDADEDINMKVAEFFTNTRTGGKLVLFVGLYDGMTDLMSQKDNYEFVFSLSVLRQVSDKKTETMLSMRKATRECLLNIIGKMVLDESQSREEKADIGWEWKREDERFIPSGEMGSVKAYGFTTSLELLVDVSSVLYKNLD